MSFLHKNKTVICLGESGSGKSTLSSILAKTHKIRSEDITCVIYMNEKIYSMPSFPITLSEESYSKHLKKISSEKISRKRTINHLFNKYDNKALVEVKCLYVLEWGDSDEIKELDDAEALQKLLISSFKPYPFNSCIESEKVFFKNLMDLIRQNKIYLWKRKKNRDISLDPKIIRHIENDSS
jgi:ABC-type dipeptide/oligopeptide/nickel transport system ATPase component